MPNKSVSKQELLKVAVLEYQSLYFQKFKLKLSLLEATEEAYAMLDGMRCLLKNSARQNLKVEYK